MQDKAVVIANRLTVGFVFAFVYQTVVGAAASLLSLPLTGNLHDLRSGIGHIDSERGYWLAAWQIASTIITTAIAVAVLRPRICIPPYKGNRNLAVPHRITAVTAMIIGAAISFLFFLLDAAIGAVASPSVSTDVWTAHHAAMGSDFAPLLVSIVFSIASGLIVVGVAGRTDKVKEITKGVGVSGITALGRRIAKKSGGTAKTTADTAGLRPGAPVHVGEKKVDRTGFGVFAYDAGRLTGSQTDGPERCLAAKGSPESFWINVAGIHDADAIRGFGQYFGLHELVQSDIMNTDLRPKIEAVGDHTRPILKTPHFEKDTGRLPIEQISTVPDQNYVISFQEISGGVFDRNKERPQSGYGEVRGKKSDYLPCLLTDVLIDSFFAVMERIGERTESLEEELMPHPSPKTLRTIHVLKRQIMVLQKTVWPLREVVGAFERTASGLVSEKIRKYPRDAYGHTIQVVDTAESLCDVVGGMPDTYLSSVSSKINEAVKTMTIIASIFIPITFIAGIYGTNFEYIPELAWGGSYLVMLAVMAAIVTATIMWFKKKQWF